MPEYYISFLFDISSFTTLQSKIGVSDVLSKLFTSYKSVPTKLKLIDAYLLYILLTGISQFVYCAIVGTFPFNAFLAGFISTVGCFVLGGLSSSFLDMP